MYTSLRSTIATAVLMLALAGGLYGSQGRGSASDNRHPNFHGAIGSWFGRAVPIPGQTICEPGTPNCAVPPEIVMVFTVHEDGTFIGIDSNIFAGGSHSTAHGEWTALGPASIKAAFTLLQSAPNGVFLGGFKNLFEANVINQNRMEGKIHAFLYLYTDANGKVITDADGFPTPSPLSPPDQCSPAVGCIPLGSFSFKVQRVSAP